MLGSGCHEPVQNGVPLCPMANQPVRPRTQNLMVSLRSMASSLCSNESLTDGSEQTLGVAFGCICSLEGILWIPDPQTRPLVT